MRFLYNAERRIFSIGFNVSEGRLDRAFYDLLASEARLGSFVAIARGDIPVEHWFAMSRPYGAIGRRRVLLSWTGTMFEYLMPLLFQRSYSNSLLDKSTREAVAIQIAYGRKHRVPWGISECAFGDLDLQKTYQYHAFGVPELGLKRGLADKIVVAPYATLLAVSIAPQEAVQNLKRLAALGLLSDYGYYEALDYSRQSSRDGRTRGDRASLHGASPGNEFLWRWPISSMTIPSSATSTPTRACARWSPCFMSASRTFRRCTTFPRASESLRWRASAKSRLRSANSKRPIPPRPRPNC